MKQFDVIANPFPRTRERQPFLVALQSDLMVRSLDTVVVAPLEPANSGTFADRLNPRVEVEGQTFVVIAQELVTVRKSVLGGDRQCPRHHHRSPRSAFRRVLMPRRLGCPRYL